MIMHFTIIITLAILILSCNTTDTKNSAEATTIDTSKGFITDTTKADILEEIVISIRSGFYDKEDILSNIEDYLYEIPFDHEWTRKQIDKAYSERLKEQSTWSKITDFDKLVKAFDKLNSSGIAALHKAGITKQDGEGDCEDIHNDLLQKGIQIKGFCYYHWQDVERVVGNENLYIGFGDFNNNDKDCLEIGKQVAAALESMGFKLRWDKTIATRIEITNINWQKRFGNDNCSNEKAISILSNTKY